MNISFAIHVPIFIIQKTSNPNHVRKSQFKNNETKNNFNMGRNSHNALDRWTTTGSILPVTPYEIWQMEKYGNFISESNPMPQEPEKTFFEYQIEIFEHDEIYNQ